MAGKNLGSLVFDIQADIAGLRKDMQSAERTIKGSTDRMAKSAKSAAAAIGSIAGALAIGAGVRKIISATREQEDAVKQLEQGLASTGGIVGHSLGELRKKAEELQSVTTFGDEEIIKAQSQLVTFTKITGEEFNKTIELAADLSTRMGTDLKSSVLQLGKALNDPVKNLSALSRSGIQFTQSQTDMIKGLAETGRMAEAQRLILKELEVQFGGSAKAARDTFGGALDGLSNAFGDLFETQGGLEDAKNAIEEMTGILSDPETKAGIDAFVTGVITGLSEVIKFTAQVAEGFKGLGEYFAQHFAGNGGRSMDELITRAQELRNELHKIENRKKSPLFPVAQDSLRISALKKELEEVVALQNVMSAFQAPEGKDKPGKEGKSGKDGVSVADAGLDKLTESTQATDTAMKSFQKALESAREAVNASGPKLTAENVQYSDLSRLTSEARIASVGGDSEKALRLAEEGVKAAMLLKESGKESGLVISGALKQLESIATKAIAPKEKDTAEPKVAKGELKIEIRGNSYSFTGNDEEMKKFVVKAVEDALTFEATAAGA